MLKDQYQSYMKLEKNERNMCQVINEEQSNNSQTIFKQLEEERSVQVRARKEI